MFAFFDGLLPEGIIRRKIGDMSHVPYTSTIQLLASYGADIAGALTILDEDEADTPIINGYEELSSEEIQRRIIAKTGTPLIYGGKKVKLSPAGAENKIPVLCKDGRFYLPTGSSPSNAIIKASDELSEMSISVQNLRLCARSPSLRWISMISTAPKRCLSTATTVW